MNISTSNLARCFLFATFDHLNTSRDKYDKSVFVNYFVLDFRVAW